MPNGLPMVTNYCPTHSYHAARRAERLYVYMIYQVYQYTQLRTPGAAIRGGGGGAAVLISYTIVDKCRNKTIDRVARYRFDWPLNSSSLFVFC